MAGLGTVQHKIVAIRHRLASRRALLANIRAYGTRLRVKVTLPQHKIRSCRAYLCTVLQKSDVMLRSVFAAHRQAVTYRFRAYRVAVETVADAFLHLLA
jgi:hypothetical protein